MSGHFHLAIDEQHKKYGIASLLLTLHVTYGAEQLLLGIMSVLQYSGSSLFIHRFRALLYCRHLAPLMLRSNLFRY